MTLQPVWKQPLQDRDRAPNLRQTYEKQSRWLSKRDLDKRPQARRGDKLQTCGINHVL